MTTSELLLIAQTLARATSLEIRRDVYQARADLTRQSAGALQSIRASITGEALRAARA